MVDFYIENELWWFWFVTFKFSLNPSTITLIGRKVFFKVSKGIFTVYIFYSLSCNIYLLYLFLASQKVFYIYSDDATTCLSKHKIKPSNFIIAQTDYYQQFFSTCSTLHFIYTSLVTHPIYIFFCILYFVVKLRYLLLNYHIFLLYFIQSYQPIDNFVCVNYVPCWP